MLVKDFTVCTALAAAIDLGKILEEKAGAVEQGQQRAIMVGGKWVEASFYVGEVLSEKNSHVGVNLPAIRNLRAGAAVPRNGDADPSRRCLS
jgi:hypothetical protein